MARQSQPREQAGHGGHAHPQAPPVPQPLTQLGQGGIGVLPAELAYERECSWIAAGLAASSMRPWGKLARAPAPLHQRLDKRAADTTPCREGPLRAAMFIRGTKEFLAKIKGVGLHVAHTRPCLPFIQLQTALEAVEKARARPLRPCRWGLGTPYGA